MLLMYFTIVRIESKISLQEVLCSTVIEWEFVYLWC